MRFASAHRVIAIDGTPLRSNTVAEMLRTRPVGTAYTLTVLRLKGEVPLGSADVSAIGRKHGGQAFVVQPPASDSHAAEPGRAYVFVATDQTACDEWVAALSNAVRSVRREARPLAGTGEVGKDRMRRARAEHLTPCVLHVSADTDTAVVMGMSILCMHGHLRT